MTTPTHTIEPSRNMRETRTQVFVWLAVILRGAPAAQRPTAERARGLCRALSDLVQKQLQEAEERNGPA